MAKKTINLSLIEEPIAIPEEIQNLTTEAFQLIWQTAYHIAQQEVEQNKQHYLQKEAEIQQQRQAALDKVTEMNNEVATVKAVLDTLKRENKTLETDLNQKFGELKSVQEQVIALQEDCQARDQEIKSLNSENIRSQESLEQLKKRLQEINRQAENDRNVAEERKEELIMGLHTQERLEKDLKATKAESEQIFKQLRTEQSRTVISEALTQELRETQKKLEAEIKVLKAEKQELKNNLEVELKTRTELDRKFVAISERTEADIEHYKALVTKLEKELEFAKNEVVSVRNRMIKTEGALERERKAIERLETKLVAAGGAKLTS